MFSPEIFLDSIGPRIQPIGVAANPAASAPYSGRQAEGHRGRRAAVAIRPYVQGSAMNNIGPGDWRLIAFLTGLGR